MQRLHQKRIFHPAHTRYSAERQHILSNDTYDIAGDGYLQQLINKLPSSDSTARPLYPGENHMVLKLKNGKNGVANYMGPNTHVVERLRRGDPGRTPADNVAKRHDIDFILAQEAPDKPTQLRFAREADKRMVSSLRKIQSGAHGGDSFRNIQAGMRGIEAKMDLENRGLLNPSTFAGDLVKHSPSDSALLKGERDKLTQQGYGLPGSGLKRQVIKKLKRDRMKRTAVSKIVKMSGRGLTLPGGQLLPSGDILKFVVHDLLPNLLKKSGLSDIPMKTVAPIIGQVLKLSRGANIDQLSQNLTHAILPLMTLKKLKMSKMTGAGLASILYSMKTKLNDKLVEAIGRAIKSYIASQRGNGLKLPGQGMCGSGLFSSIGSAFKRAFSSIPRAALAVGSMGISETFLQPLDVVKKTTGIKGSQVLDLVSPVLGVVGGPEMGIAGKLTSSVLKKIDL
jgi:hypothetical protein